MDAPFANISGIYEENKLLILVVVTCNGFSCIQ